MSTPTTGPVDAVKPPASWRAVHASNLLSLAVVIWIAWSNLAIGWQVRGATTVALIAIPPWPFYVAALLVVFVLAGIALRARLRGAGPEARVFRLLPIALVLIGGIHVLVLPIYALPFGAEKAMASQLAMIEQDLRPSADGRLPVAPEEIALLTLPPPLLRDGQPMQAWNVVVRTDCSGPVTEVPSGTEAGTLFYCTSPERLTAWVTAVGLGESLAGEPSIVQWEGRPAIAVVELAVPGAASPRLPEAAAAPESPPLP